MAAVSVALQPLVRVVPMTAVEWADQYYYLPKESSYGDGEWKTLPFQIAIMNSMGNDQVRTVNLIKSARVGYTKMLLGVVGYFIEHKSRNSLLFQPTDSAAEDFMKSHVETTIRDVPCLKDLSPWLGRKHRDNTLTLKRFSSGVGFWSPCYIKLRRSAVAYPAYFAQCHIQTFQPVLNTVLLRFNLYNYTIL